VREGRIHDLGQELGLGRDAGRVQDVDDFQQVLALWHGDRHQFVSRAANHQFDQLARRDRRFHAIVTGAKVRGDPALARVQAKVAGVFQQARGRQQLGDLARTRTLGDLHVHRPAR